MQPSNPIKSTPEGQEFQQKTQDILERIKNLPHYKASPEEIEILMRPEQSETTRKFAVLSLFKAERFAEAMPFAREMADREPNEENLKNLWVILLRVKDREGLLEVAA